MICDWPIEIKRIEATPAPNATQNRLEGSGDGSSGPADDTIGGTSDGTEHLRPPGCLLAGVFCSRSGVASITRYRTNLLPIGQRNVEVSTCGGTTREIDVLPKVTPEELETLPCGGYSRRRLERLCLDLTAPSGHGHRDQRRDIRMEITSYSFKEVRVMLRGSINRGRRHMGQNQPTTQTASKKKID
jgi:hypothetical protein